MGTLGPTLQKQETPKFFTPIFKSFSLSNNDKAWMSCVRCSLCEYAGNDENAKSVEQDRRYLSRWPVHHIFVEGRGPVVLSCWNFFSFVYRAIVPTKFALKLTDVVVQTRNRQKCPRLRGREFPNFCRPFSNLGHFRKCGKVWLNSVQKPPSSVFEEGVKYNGLQCIRTSCHKSV